MKKGSFTSFLKKYSFSGVLCRRLESSLSIKSCCATLNATTPRLRFGYFSIEAFFDGLPVECSDVERISWLVAHHHTYTNIDGPDHQILLDEILMLMLPTGIIYAYYALPDMWDSLYGALFAGGLMLLIFLLSRGGMGAGDVKLSFVLGVWLGLKASVVCLMLAFVLGGIIGVLLLVTGIKQRKDPIPFGPFLCIGAYIALLFSPYLIYFYWNLFV